MGCWLRSSAELMTEGGGIFVDEGPIATKASLPTAKPIPSSSLIKGHDQAAETTVPSLANSKGNAEVSDIFTPKKTLSPFPYEKGIVIKEPVILSTTPLVVEEDFTLSYSLGYSRLLNKY